MDFEADVGVVPFVGKSSFSLKLFGPQVLLRNAMETSRMLSLTHISKSDMLCPTFIPSSGRADIGQLNLSADHTFGKPSSLCMPVVFCVVAASEVGAYKKKWPQMLLLALPPIATGVGFSRYCIQMMCSSGKLVAPGSATDTQFRFPFAWLLDDAVSMFYKIVPLPQAAVSTAPRRGQSRCVVRATREVVPTAFKAAFMSVQRLPCMTNIAVAGFLRDDGTCCTKKLQYRMGAMSLYKVVLLNLEELRRLDCAYEPALRKFEDLHLYMQVSQKGGRLLKSQEFAYQSSHRRAGGCSESRNKCSSDLAQLMEPSAFRALPPDRQAHVTTLLGWAQARERKSAQCTRKRKANELAVASSPSSGDSTTSTSSS